MNPISHFIIVDDDPFNNIICKMNIENTLGDVDVKTFSVPEEALLFLQKEFIYSLTPTILLLDINMPTISGWQFLEEFEKFSEAVKKQFAVYIVSSSVDQRDIDKAAANKHIKAMFSKPLKKEIIISITNAEIN